jgi:hypothetical protein
MDRSDMKNVFIFLSLCLGLGYSAVLYSAEWTLDIRSSPTFGYDDNVLLNEDEKDSFTFKISPTLVLGRAVENMSSSIELGYAIDRFSSISRLDSENPFARFNTNYSLERIQLGLSASYTENNVRDEAEEDSGDFSTDATSRTRSFSPSISYKLTEKDSLTGNYNYSERLNSSTAFADNETNSITVGWTRRFTERFTGGLNSTVSNFKTDSLTSSSDDDSYNISTFIGYQLSEVWLVDANIGFRRLNAERKSNLGTITKDSSNGSTFDVSSTYDKELDSVSFTYSKQLLPSSSGDVNEQDSVNFNWSRKLTERLTANLTTSYRETRTASEQLSDEKRENINFSPSLRWQVDSRLGINFGYHFKQQKRDTAKDVESNAISIAVTYDWDGFRVSR